MFFNTKKIFKIKLDRCGADTHTRESTSTLPVFALERDFASLYTLWGELSQNELTNASVLSLPGETLKTD